MVSLTNSELRLAQRLQPLRSQYAAILIDTPPTFGPLMNSALSPHSSSGWVSERIHPGWRFASLSKRSFDRT
jgi:hypothetical protein